MNSRHKSRRRQLHAAQFVDDNYTPTFVGLAQGRQCHTIKGRHVNAEAADPKIGVIVLVSQDSFRPGQVMDHEANSSSMPSLLVRQETADRRAVLVEEIHQAARDRRLADLRRTFEQHAKQPNLIWIEGVLRSHLVRVARAATAPPGIGRHKTGTSDSELLSNSTDGQVSFRPRKPAGADGRRQELTTRLQDSASTYLNTEQVNAESFAGIGGEGESGG